MKSTKIFYKSWTVWINFAILFFALFDREYLSLFKLTDAQIMIILASMTKATAFLNIIMRLFISKTGLTLKDHE